MVKVIKKRTAESMLLDAIAYWRANQYYLRDEKSRDRHMRIIQNANNVMEKVEIYLLAKQMEVRQNAKLV